MLNRFVREKFLYLTVGDHLSLFIRCGYESG